MKNTLQVCKMGLWDENIPGINFDENGISNYAKLQLKLMELYPRGKKGRKDWEKIVDRVKSSGKNKPYDCIVGVSGGVDSSYLLYLLKEEYGLRPLAVMLDNGWNSEIAVNNIKLITRKLNIDLETYVIDYEEIKDLIRSYMFASLPWIDSPTDRAIKSIMYKIASKENIKFVFRGNDFRTEGKQPKEWTYSDAKQLRYVHKKFGRLNKLKSYPHLTILSVVYYSFLKKIKEIRPYYYLDYSKNEAKKFLEDNYGWSYYGGHHHENIFTKFVMSYWLPKKFSIDKRVINLSAQVVSGELERSEAYKKLNTSPLSEKELNDLKNYVIKKLDMSDSEFSKIMENPNKFYFDYPNQERLFRFIIKFFKPVIKLIYPQKPMTFIQMEMDMKK